MQFTIIGKNFTVRDHLRDAVQSKFERLGKYFVGDIHVQVAMETDNERQRHTAEATIIVKGTIFRAVDTSHDLYLSLDNVVSKLSSQMSRHKTKLQRKYKDHSELAFSAIPDHPEVTDEEPRIVKTKRFDIKPMSPEEAILQMELIDHNFFVFTNQESDAVNVIYKRKDGKYGLLEPNY